MSSVGNYFSIDFMSNDDNNLGRFAPRCLIAVKFRQASSVSKFYLGTSKVFTCVHEKFLPMYKKSFTYV
jgi:hypothetical protein